MLLNADELGTSCSGNYPKHYGISTRIYGSKYGIANIFWTHGISTLWSMVMYCNSSSMANISNWL